MAKLDVYNMEGAVTGSIELSDDIFGIEPNQDVLHRVVLNQLANRRQGTHSTKTRSEVRGGGKRPYRQKGTGRARHGSTRSAQYVGGGIIFGPKPRDYSYTLPKKVRRLAMKSALSGKVAAGGMIVLEKLEMSEIKTKNMAKLLAKLGADKSALVVTATRDENVEKSTRNIANIKTALVNTINVYDILKYDKFVVTKEAVLKVQEVYV
ncbi:MAG: large subunit ribosomal protein [Clostridiales bacterium]|jgi:large subunit ribosomal protein L4|nr:50S ribosomal protein L4 [Eubacteriales bacterium]MDD3197636.1 50S ribosomal protein L4 [Eubacteriales bacterium]MDD4682842.1 50S ribosomal protein L4 [Eubacteriales bacterium]MDN5313761.1 large subunit ribosomal protein [Clostridiales bacterium]